MKVAHAVHGVLCCLFLFAVPSLRAQSLPGTVEGAKKEGKLVYYTVLTLPESQALVAAFEKKYPFVKTELFRLEGDKMRAKILTEARAGRYTVDVTSNSITNTGLLIRDGMLAPYKSQGRERIWPGLKDHDGYWTSLYVRLYVIAYNLPAASRFTSRRGLIAVLAVGLLLITIATFVNVRSSSRASAIRAINAAPATDAGVVTPEPPHIAAVSPDHVDAGQLSLGIDAGASVQLSPTQSKSNAIAPMPETGRRTRNIVPADPQRTPSTPDTAPFGEPKSAPHSQPSAIKKGELAIEVDTWAIIWLDGKQDEAPYRVKLPAGRYRLRMQHDDKDETMTVVVRPDEITIIKRNW